MHLHIKYVLLDDNLSQERLVFVPKHAMPFNIVYFLQRDNIMLHFTRKGSSDVTGFDLFTFLLTWKVLRDLNLDLTLESVAGFKFGFKLGFKFGLKIEFKLGL